MFPAARDPNFQTEGGFTLDMLLKRVQTVLQVQQHIAVYICNVSSAYTRQGCLWRQRRRSVDAGVGQANEVLLKTAIKWHLNTWIIPCFSLKMNTCTIYARKADLMITQQPVAIMLVL